MFKTELLDDIKVQARETAVQVCWAQWIAVGSMASPTGSRSVESIIDPEALVLLSLRLVNQERRLWDFVSWWADVGAGLTSLQRLRALLARSPADTTHDAFRQFARMAADAGDARWGSHVGQASASPHRSGRSHPLALVHPSTLWLRLRAGFGVGAKSDALAFLLGLRGAGASVRTISTATGYSDVTIRKVVGEMALARIVRETHVRPAEYAAPSRSWATLLDLQSPDGGGTDPAIPRWRYWSEIFAYLAHVIVWSQPADLPDATGPRVLASRARDILDEFRLPFAFNDIPVPDPKAFQGIEAIDCLSETTSRLASWITHHM
jgi:hypothetical protein